MKRWISLLLIAGVSVMASGCFKYRGELPGVLRRIPARQYEIVDHFEVEIERKWVVFGLLPVAHDDLEAEVRRAVREAGGDGAVNVEIVTEFDAADALWNVVLVPALCGMSRHLIVKGDVVKFREEG